MIASEDDFFTLNIPPKVTTVMGNRLQAAVQKLLKAMDLLSFYPEICISYATGWRKGLDDFGCGPGMYEVAHVIKFLFEAGFPCYSGLQVEGGQNWERFLLRLAHSNCKILIVLVTPALYRSW